MSDALPTLPRRNLDAHKGDLGRVLLIAGSRGMVGAAALAAHGALRSGAGLVTVATAESVEPVLAAKLNSAMTLPLPAANANCIAAAALSPALRATESADCVGVGPGLGRHPETLQFLSGLLQGLNKPLVLDADGLNLVSDGLHRELRACSCPKILTPHPGEMSRLLDTTIQDVREDREAAALEAARNYGAVVVLKGAGTVVTDGRQVHINATGNPGMATGGAGDVLTGILSALVGQGLEALDAARLGTHVHGLAGDLAAGVLGQVSLTASDLIDHLPAAYQALEKNR